MGICAKSECTLKFIELRDYELFSIHTIGYEQRRRKKLLQILFFCGLLHTFLLPIIDTLFNEVIKLRDECNKRHMHEVW